MRTFVQKPKTTQQATAAKSTKPDQSFFGQHREVRSALQLQRTIENQAAQELSEDRTESHEASLTSSTSRGLPYDFNHAPLDSITDGNIQPKLMANTPGDAHEQEADRVAAQVMEINSSQPAVQEMPSKAMEAEEGHAFESSNGIETQLSSSSGGGNALPDGVRTFMEPHFGTDFSQVRVHADEAAARKSSALNARAFTRGPDIFFNRGQYAPEATAGRQLLAHELTHAVQQSHLPSGDSVGLPLQCESMISDREYFLFAGQEGGSGFGFSDLVSAVQRRYRLDRTASWMLASWLNQRHQIFHNRRDRRYDSDFRVDMPRAVAFFVVDWIEPFNPFVSSAAGAGSQYRIESRAFDHAQEIWARQNVFVGFRRGRGMADPALQQVQFQAATNADLTPRLNSPSDLNLLAQRPSGALPPGFFHIMVTGSTTESASASGKSVRSSARQPVVDANQGVILFAEVYAREGYQQRVGPSSTEPELGELLSHEIGHFLFGLSHGDLVFDPATGGFTDVQRRGIMQQGHTGLTQSDERFSTESRHDIDEAFRTGGVFPRPQTPTSR